MTTPRTPTENPLADLARLFLRLGTVAFGGPAAHVAMMEDEVVTRRGWLTREAFLDLLGAANLIPGPNSTELAIHVGHRRGGARGLVVAGACFILPAFFIVLAIAWAYERWGRLPEAEALLYGVKPVVIAVILQALGRLAPTALKTRRLAGLAAAAGVADWLGARGVLVLLGTGLATAAGVARGRTPALGAALAAGGGASLAAVPFSLPALFLYFVFVGSVLFGSGYVLVALLEDTLVGRWGWLTERQLLDAIAIGQVTPGPVFTTATFIGFVLGGVKGGVVATVGIFLPAFVFVRLSAPWIPRLRASPAAGAFLDGVNAAAVALILVVTLRLAGAALVDPVAWAVAGGAGIALWRWNVNSARLVAAGGLVGLVSGWVRGL